MNKEQAKAWLPLIQAVADGKTLQSKTLSGRWVDSLGGDMTIVTFKSPESFRIKPEPKKQQYRICLIHYKTGKYGVGVCQTNDEEEEVQSHDEFVRWLTDQVEYELPEGEA